MRVVIAGRQELSTEAAQLLGWLFRGWWEGGKARIPAPGLASAFDLSGFRLICINLSLYALPLL